MLSVSSLKCRFRWLQVMLLIYFASKTFHFSFNCHCFFVSKEGPRHLRIKCLLWFSNDRIFILIWIVLRDEATGACIPAITRLLCQTKLKEIGISFHHIQGWSLLFIIIIPGKHLLIFTDCNFIHCYHFKKKLLNTFNVFVVITHIWVVKRFLLSASDTNSTFMF